MNQDSPKQDTAAKLGEIAYPVDFPIKVMGRREPGFARTVVDIVRKHAPDFDEATVEMRPSKKNTYLSVTCTIVATSREQLDALYQELNDNPAVVMVL
jgi:putative lipoic acid-binding regulatory protein